MDRMQQRHAGGLSVGWCGVLVSWWCGVWCGCVGVVGAGVVSCAPARCGQRACQPLVQREHLRRKAELIPYKACQLCQHVRGSRLSLC